MPPTDQLNNTLEDESTCLVPSDHTPAVSPPSEPISSRESPAELRDKRGTEQIHTPLLPSEPMQTSTGPIASPSRDTPSNGTSSMPTTETSHARHELQLPNNTISGQMAAPALRLTPPSAGYPPYHKAQPYSYGQQKWQVWRIAVGEFMVTTILCMLYLAVLVYFQRKDNLYKVDQSWLNAVTETTTFLLGVSIANAFRSYAKYLRWRILAAKPRSLETFDLVLASDSLVNVFKLLYKGGRHGVEETRGFKRYFPSRTQICCVCWVALKVTVTFLVGYAGSLKSLSIGDPIVGIDQGEVKFTDFAALGGIESDANLRRMRTWASRGLRYNTTQGLDHVYTKIPRISTLSNGTSAYWPVVIDAKDQTIRAVSYLQIRADTFCQVYTVTDGQFGNQSEITYLDDKGRKGVYTFPNTTQPGPGGLLVSSQINSTCGPRCINVDAFVAQTKPGEPIRSPGRKLTVTYDQASFFKCNNTVSSTMHADCKGNLKVPPEEYALSDSWAQMVAGAVGWESEGDIIDSDDLEGGKRRTAMFAPYPAMSELGKFLAIRYQSTPNVTMIADVIASVSMKALTAADDNTVGLRWFITHKNSCMPIHKIKLELEGIQVGGILGTIVFGQFVTLVLVFVFANGAIIGGDNPLSIAKLYYSLLQRRGFGEFGSFLDGKKLIKTMDDCDVIYGWTNTRDGESGQELRHLDVFDAGQEQVFSDFKDQKIHYYN